jgi:CheY-like chemotaxis protein
LVAPGSTTFAERSEVPEQPRILMVEDHPDIADLYQLKLQLEGYRVAVARDGPSGLDLARSLLPDVILLDVHLPVLDGIQVLAELRADNATRNIPVVVFTEDENPSLAATARQFAITDYLIKAQLLPSSLAQVIARALHDRAAQQSQPGAAAS